MDERTSLISGIFQQENYPEEKEGFTDISKYDISQLEWKINENSGIYSKKNIEAQLVLDDLEEEFKRDESYAYFN